MPTQRRGRSRRRGQRPIPWTVVCTSNVSSTTPYYRFILHDQSVSGAVLRSWGINDILRCQFAPTMRRVGAAALLSEARHPLSREYEVEHESAGVEFISSPPTEGKEDAECPPNAWLQPHTNAVNEFSVMCETDVAVAATTRFVELLGGTWQFRRGIVLNALHARAERSLQRARSFHTKPAPAPREETFPLNWLPVMLRDKKFSAKISNKDLGLTEWIICDCGKQHKMHAQTLRQAVQINYPGGAKNMYHDTCNTDVAKCPRQFAINHARSAITGIETATNPGKLMPIGACACALHMLTRHVADIPWSIGTNSRVSRMTRLLLTEPRVATQVQTLKLPEGKPRSREFRFHWLHATALLDMLETTNDTLRVLAHPLYTKEDNHRPIQLDDKAVARQVITGLRAWFAGPATMQLDIPLLDEIGIGFLDVGVKRRSCIYFGMCGGVLVMSLVDKHVGLRYAGRTLPLLSLPLHSGNVQSYSLELQARQIDGSYARVWGHGMIARSPATHAVTRDRSATQELMRSAFAGIANLRELSPSVFHRVAGDVIDCSCMTFNAASVALALVAILTPNALFTYLSSGASPTDVCSAATMSLRHSDTTVKWLFSIIQEHPVEKDRPIGESRVFTRAPIRDLLEVLGEGIAMCGGAAPSKWILLACHQGAALGDELFSMAAAVDGAPPVPVATCPFVGKPLVCACHECSTVFQAWASVHSQVENCAEGLHAVRHDFDDAVLGAIPACNASMSFLQEIRVEGERGSLGADLRRARGSTKKSLRALMRVGKDPFLKATSRVSQWRSAAYATMSQNGNTLRKLEMQRVEELCAEPSPAAATGKKKKQMRHKLKKVLRNEKRRSCRSIMFWVQERQLEQFPEFVQWRSRAVALHKLRRRCEWERMRALLRRTTGWCFPELEACLEKRSKTVAKPKVQPEARPEARPCACGWRQGMSYSFQKEWVQSWFYSRGLSAAPVRL